MSRAAFEAPFSGAIDEALERANDRAALEALGAEILARKGDLGPVVLPEATSIMRDTFERFAREVVAPQAEAIHREDLTIPEDIIEALGCFGPSVPSASGLLPDDREDTLGMIVATEALSKASPGAAGALSLDQRSLPERSSPEARKIRKLIGCRALRRGAARGHLRHRAGHGLRRRLRGSPGHALQAAGA